MNAIIPFASFWNSLAGRPCAGTVAKVEHLGKRSLARRTLRAGGMVECLRGRIWLTAGHQDIVLREGECYTSPRQVRVVVEALEDSVVR
ncbi:DUF2917 domain-containing protein [Luteolibacter sp. LG18]|uniref:DUF2917 domain-containing protein n=1 Tax=Luteolibacter sp. LG18 TaxID=2819286 RepID=UPI002B2A12B3|nr:hypothetical protein llg_26080 [Luteolibacter sp. LG18]